jgi:HSP20 family protein
MALMRYEPINLLAEINRLFDHSLRSGRGDDTSNIETSQWTPAVDIKETVAQFVILVDLPGIDKKDVSIAMENNVLTIRGERNTYTSDKKEDKGQQYYRVERSSGSFYRRFTLPETVDSKGIQAKMQQGVLEISIPKQEKTQSRQIQIEFRD